MDDAMVVGRLYRLGDLTRNRQSLTQRHWATGDGVRQVFAFDELHHDGARRSRALDAVNMSDVRMIQRGESFGFPFETREPTGVGRDPGRQNLDGDVPIEFRITGAIDFAHAALSDEGLDVVRADACSRGKHLDASSIR